MARSLILLISIFALSSYKVTTSTSEKVNWIGFKELDEKMMGHKKPVIIDIYTDWCHWCKVMDKETYENHNVAKYINDNFYAISFNAEGKEPVTFRNKVYNYSDQYKINTLTMALTNGQLSFPTTIIIPDESSQPIAIAGFLKPKELEIIIKYFGSGSYKQMQFPEFQKGFHASW